MITWKIDENDFLELVFRAVDDWVGNAINSEEADAYKDWYSDFIEIGAISEFTGTIDEMVDNDIINYTSIYDSIEECAEDWDMDVEEFVEDEDKVLFQASNGKIIVSTH